MNFYSLIAFNESNLLASTRQFTAFLHVCFLQFMHIQLHTGSGYMRAYMYVQIMQHTHMHKTITGHVEAKKILS